MTDVSSPLEAAASADAYSLVETLKDGSSLSELFRAPSEAEAIARVKDVIEQDVQAELWLGPKLVWRSKAFARP